VPQTTTFGRRQAPSGYTPPTRPESTRLAPPAALSESAEAFRAEVAADLGAASSFRRWRRTPDGRKLLMWAATGASVIPGIVTFVIGAPLIVSIGLEALSFVGNIWLRRERRRRLREIVEWQEPADAG